MDVDNTPHRDPSVQCTTKDIEDGTNEPGTAILHTESPDDCAGSSFLSAGSLIDDHGTDLTIQTPSALVDQIPSERIARASLEPNEQTSIQHKQRSTTRNPDHDRPSSSSVQPRNEPQSSNVRNDRRQISAGKLRHSGRRPGVSTAKKKVPQAMQAQWRIGAAPSAALTLSREEQETSKVLAQAQAFYTSMFEVFWGPQTTANPYVFDLDNRVELFRDSSVTAACLVAADKSQTARETLNRVLPSIDAMLQNPHPALYFILAELSLGLVKTPNDAFRDQVVLYVARRAYSLLGNQHPITALLRLQLPASKKEALGERLWEILLPLMTRSFGSDHYQSSTQVFCQARNRASSGRFDEAVGSIERLIDRWSQLYGSNSLIVCYSKIELANILASAGSDMKAEFVVSDALRTSDMIQAAELKNEDCHASEKRHREASIAFPKVAGYRTLGKLHRLRGNFGAARYYYSQAIAIGNPSLGENSAAVQLAQNELASTQELELRQSLQNFTLDELAKFTDIVGSPVC